MNVSEFFVRTTCTNIAVSLEIMSQVDGLTDQCHHYEEIGEVPWDMQK